MRGDAVEERIQQILSYAQEESANVWKENILEDLELENLEYETAKKLLANLKKKFRRENKEVVKVIELKRLEQEEKTIEEFVQELQRKARESSYEGRLLVEEFKRGMNRTIQ